MNPACNGPVRRFRALVLCLGKTENGPKSHLFDVSCEPLGPVPSTRCSAKHALGSANSALHASGRRSPATFSLHHRGSLLFIVVRCGDNPKLFDMLAFLQLAEKPYHGSGGGYGLICANGSLHNNRHGVQCRGRFRRSVPQPYRHAQRELPESR